MQPAAAFTARVLRARSMLLSSVHGYRSSWVIGDLVAALTLLAIAVPEQLATARLAGMSPITGFYAFVARKRDGRAVGILLRLGRVADFLSVPIISGFLGGVAVIIAVH